MLQLNIDENIFFIIVAKQLTRSNLRRGWRLLLAQSVGTTHRGYLLFDGRNSHSCGTKGPISSLAYILEDQTHRGEC